MKIVLILFLLITSANCIFFSNVVEYNCDGGGISFSVSGNVGPYNIIWFPAGPVGNNVTGLSSGNYTVMIEDSISNANHSFTISDTKAVLDPNWDTYSISRNPLYATSHLGIYIDIALDNDTIVSNVSQVILGFNGTQPVSVFWQSTGGVFDNPFTLYPLFYPFFTTNTTEVRLTYVDPYGCSQIISIPYATSRVRPTIDIVQKPSIGGIDSIIVFNFVASYSVHIPMLCQVILNALGDSYIVQYGYIDTPSYPATSSYFLGAGIYHILYYLEYPLYTGDRMLYFDLVERLTVNTRSYTKPGQNPIVFHDGTAPFTYSWTGGAMTDASLENPGFLSPESVYTVTVCDSLMRCATNSTTYVDLQFNYSVNEISCGQYSIEAIYLGGGVGDIQYFWYSNQPLVNINDTYVKTAMTANTSMSLTLKDDSGQIVAKFIALEYIKPKLYVNYTENCDISSLIYCDRDVCVTLNNTSEIPCSLSLEPCIVQTENITLDGSLLTATEITLEQASISFSIFSLTEYHNNTFVKSLDLASLDWNITVYNYSCYQMVVSSSAENITITRYLPYTDMCEVYDGVILNSSDVKYTFEVGSWSFEDVHNILVLKTIYNLSSIKSPILQELENSVECLIRSQDIRVTISHLTFAVNDGVETPAQISINISKDEGIIVSEITFSHFNQSLYYDPILSLLFAPTNQGNGYSMTHLYSVVIAFGVAIATIVAVILFTMTDVGHRLLYGEEALRVKKLRSFISDNDISPDLERVY